MKVSISVFILCIIATALSGADQNSNGAPDVRFNVQSSTQTPMMSEKENGGTAEDRRVLNEILYLLRGSYSRYNLNVHIDDGVVTITGTVRSTDDLLDIQNAVQRIKGVKGVNNQLHVEGPVGKKK